MTDDKILDMEERIREIEERLDKLNPESIEQLLDRLKTQSENVFGMPEEDSKDSQATYTGGLQQELEANIKEAAEILQTLQNEHETVQDQNQKLHSFYIKIYGDENTKGLNQTISTHKKDIVNTKNEIEKYHQLLLGNEKSIKNQIKETQAEIQATNTQIKEKLSEAKSILTTLENNREDLNQFHTKVFGKKADDEEGTDAIQGLKQEFDDRKQELQVLIDNHKKQYSSIHAEINTLLTGATTVNLASSYQDLKESCDEPIQKSHTGFLVSVFLISAVLISIVFNEVFLSEKKTVSSWIDIFSFYSLRISAIAPLIWLAIHFSLKNKQFTRLQQEYAHKEALAKSYLAFKEQIDTLNIEDDQDALTNKLLDSTIDAISFNAATILSKDSDKPESLHEQITNIIRKKAPKEDE